MSLFEDAAKFRSSSEPIVALWSAGGIRAYGSLVWVTENPILTLYVEVEGVSDLDLDSDLPPILNATKPPLQTTFTGMAQGFGVITLESCARYNVRTSQNFKAGRVTYELEFMPTAVWMGVEKDEIDRIVRSVVLSDTRLGGYFGFPNIKTFNRFDPDVREVFDLLDKPASVWAVYGTNQHQIELGDTGWLLSLHTSSLEGTSATEGHTLQSVINIVIHAPNLVTISEASSYVMRIEEIFSTFSIESFTFQYEEYCSEDRRVILVWRLDERRSLFRPPMKHQILIDFTDIITFRSVCRQWFLASPTISLSRWLFVRALRESDNGLARFVAVAQAFEVLGRELGPDGAMPRQRLKEAVGLIREALHGKYEDGFLNRVISLVQSSNRSSYRAVLYHILDGVMQRFGIGSSEKAEKLSKLISDTRNAVVHMTSDDQGKLNDAFGRVNKLSLQLCFWYAVCQADQMNLSIPDLETFLFNNRNARHGLPNEVLDRSKRGK